MARGGQRGGRRANTRTNESVERSITVLPSSSGTTIEDINLGLAYKRSPTFGPAPAMSAPLLEPRSSSHESLPLRSSGLPLDNPDATTNGNLSIMGQKELMNTIKRLEGLNLKKLDVPLPRIVVLGDQSAGKSSLIEGISGINLPRKAGTCTRCPLSITLAPSETRGAPWSARVYIRKLYDFYGDNNHTLSSDHAFHGWQTKDRSSEIDFGIAGSKKDLEQMIWRGQLAVLNPDKDPSTFATKLSWAEVKNFQSLTDFSPNIVCIDILESEAPSLSFFDLPGIIQNASGKGKEHLPKFVEDLVIGYVQDPDAIILLAIAMESDVRVSRALKIAMDVEADDRCIGVLTKPDRFPKGGDLDTWTAILNGTDHPLGHGYYVTKQPFHTALEGGLTHAEARYQEELFFDKEPLWSSTFAYHRSRFGTRSVQEILSKLLASQILKSLPDIRKSIESRLQDVEIKLQDIPKPPIHSAQGIIIGLLRSFSCQIFSDEVHKNVQDTGEHFMKELQSLRPTLISKAVLDEGLYRLAQAMNTSVNTCIVIDDDDDEDARTPAHPVTPAKKRKLETPPGSGQKSAVARPSAENQSTTKVTKHELAKSFTLDELRKKLNDKSRSQVPDRVDPKREEEIMMSCLAHLDHPTNLFLKQLEHQLTQHVSDVFKASFQRWNDTALCRESWKHIEQFLKTKFTALEDSFRQILSKERQVFFIGEEDFFKWRKLLALEQYRTGRFGARAMILLREKCAALDLETPKTKSEKDRELSKVVKDHRGIIEMEPYAREVEVMANVKAYYELASNRYRANICMTVDYEMFKNTGTELENDLCSRLQIYEENGANRCMTLLAENSERERQRQQLEKEKQALLDGKRCIEELDRKYLELDSNTSGLRSMPSTAVSEMEMDLV